MVEVDDDILTRQCNATISAWLPHLLTYQSIAQYLSTTATTAATATATATATAATTEAIGDKDRCEDVHCPVGHLQELKSRKVSYKRNTHHSSHFATSAKKKWDPMISVY
jgi:hypothetical protein